MGMAKHFQSSKNKKVCNQSSKNKKVCNVYTISLKKKVRDEVDEDFFWCR